MSYHDTQGLAKKLLDFMKDAGYRPLKDHHLADEIGLLTHERSFLRQVLHDLHDRGLARKIKGNRWTAASADRPGDALVGTLFASPQGHGMVRLTGRAGADAEVFIPPGSLGSALHGDVVEVEINRTAEERRSRRGGSDAAETEHYRAGGRVIRLVERRKKVLVGLLLQSPTYSYVIPDHPRINRNVLVSAVDLPDGRAPQPGHKVVVRLADDLRGEMLQGVVIEDLGDPEASGVDVLSILRDHQIATGFSESTENEARAHTGMFDENDLEGRLDLRSEMIITIDPSDAKDHDDAVSLRRQPEGGWILGVHIADVSHFVTPGSAIDRDAREHGNSVYMVDRFIPMLPPYLTSEVCSLKAGRDRLAYSVFITYDDQADVIGVAMGTSVIHPCLLVDYDKVQQLIVKGESTEIPGVYHENLRDMHELAAKLRERRMLRGALDLSMPEVSCKLDKQGRPVSIKRRTSVEAYQLIEEFMLAANVAVAERLETSQTPAMYRIHEEPTPEQWIQMASDLQQLGLDAAPEDRHDIQRIARAYLDQPLGYPVSLAILRNLKRALYSAECSQHFGLAFERYTHFTSPIRRYADLVVHRQLKRLDAGSSSVVSRKEVEEIADHCSVREREADEAEEQSLIIKRIQYYEDLLTRGETGPWPALVTGATTRGLLVEIVETLQRGFIPSHALPDPEIKLDRKTGYLTGRKGRRFARIGDVIATELLRVDKARRSLELRWIDVGSNPKATPKGKSSSASRRPARRPSPRLRDDRA